MLLQRIFRMSSAPPPSQGGGFALVFKERDSKKHLQSDRSQKFIFMATSAKNIFNSTKSKEYFHKDKGQNIILQAISDKTFSKRKALKNTFTVTLIAKKSFSERPGRHALQNYFQRNKHQKMIQNDNRQ